MQPTAAHRHRQFLPVPPSGPSPTPIDHTVQPLQHQHQVCRQRRSVGRPSDGGTEQKGAGKIGNFARLHSTNKDAIVRFSTIQFEYTFSPIDWCWSPCRPMSACPPSSCDVRLTGEISPFERRKTTAAAATAEPQAQTSPHPATPDTRRARPHRGRRGQQVCRRVASASPPSRSSGERQEAGTNQPTDDGPPTDRTTRRRERRGTAGTGTRCAHVWWCVSSLAPLGVA